MYIGLDIQNKFPLSPKKPLKKTLRNLFFLAFGLIPLWFVLGAGLVSFLFATNPPQGFTIILAILLLSFAIIFFLVYQYEKWYYRSYFYDLTDDYVIIKKGPLAPQEITIPYERIQDVYLDQDLLDRCFGLYDIHISTATETSGVRAHIDGVNHTSARALREIILRKMKEKRA